MDECTETVVKEVKILDNNENKCNSCILYIVLFSIYFITNVRISTYFAYYKYMNLNKENISKYDYAYHV